MTATLAHDGPAENHMSSLGCGQLVTTSGAGWPLSFIHSVLALQSGGCHVCCVSSGFGSWQGHAEASSAMEGSVACFFTQAGSKCCFCPIWPL